MQLALDLVRFMGCVGAVCIGSAFASTTGVPPAPGAPIGALGESCGSCDVHIPVTLDGVESRAHLRRRSLRAESFGVRLLGRAGEEMEYEPRPAQTYVGWFEGAAGELAVGLVAGQLRGVFVGPDRVVPVGLPALSVHGAHGETQSDPEGCVDRALVAMDADYEHFERLGMDPDAVIADAEALLNAVNAVFRRDARLEHVLGEFLIRIDPDDPYTSTDAFFRLREFRDHWNRHHQDIERDIAHLLSGVRFDEALGWSFQSVVCTEPQLSYSLHASLDAGGPVERMGLMAHELGHNWGAFHCDDPDCRIMCCEVDGCPCSSEGFGAQSRELIRSWVDVRGSCLERCACEADLDGDGDADAEDFFAYLDLFAINDPGADLDGDGDADADDLFMYLDLFSGCV